MQTAINLGEGTSTSQILSRLCLKYGSVSTFDDLIKAYLGIAQRSTELVTDYVVRLERSYSRLCSEYPQRFDRNSQTQHLRARFYQGLRKEIQSRMTPSYNDNRVSYLKLLRQARQLEREYPPRPDNPLESDQTYGSQLREVIACMKKIS